MNLVYVIAGLVIVLLAYFVKKRKAKVFLRGGNQWQEVTLIDKKQISHDTKIFTFGLPDPTLPLGLPLGSHIIFRAHIISKAKPQGEEVTRKYTPTSPFNEKGKVVIPIKVYYKNTHPSFPEGGLMTQYLDSLSIGSKIDISGPKGRLTYLKGGFFQIEKNPKFRVKHLGLIAGGTGITPCFQLIQYIIDQESGLLSLSLIYANKTEGDILLRDELKKYQDSGKLKLFYTLDNPPNGWTFGAGFITQDMIKSNLPAPDDTLVCYCGPPGMNGVVSKHLQGLGYARTFKF